MVNMFIIATNIISITGKLYEFQYEFQIYDVSYLK